MEAQEARPRRRAAPAPRRRLSPQLELCRPPARPRPARTRPRRAAARGRSHSRTVCAPTACPTSQTRSPAADSCSKYLPAPTPPRPRTGRRARSARELCPTASAPTRGPHRPIRHSRNCSGSQSACASTASPNSPTPEPPSRPTSTQRHPRDHQLRRGNPAVPDHDQPSIPGIQAGPNRVRRTATRPSPLINHQAEATRFVPLRDSAVMSDQPRRRSPLLNLRHRSKWLIAVGIGLVAIIGMRYLLLPRADSVAEAEHFLAGPPTFGFPGEHGQPTAHCIGPPLFGFFATTDRSPHADIPVGTRLQV